MLRVLGKASSINVRKVLWTCDEIGIAYEREDWGSGVRATSEPDFLSLNPHGLVPVLVDGGLVLRESNTIVRYLAARYGPPELLPPSPHGRALVEQWMDWQATDLNQSWVYAFQALVRRNPAFADAAQVATSIREWNRNIALLDRHLSAGYRYVAGDTFTVADVPIGLSLNRWLMTPLADRPDVPAVTAYLALLSGRPAFMRHGRNGIP